MDYMNREHVIANLVPRDEMALPDKAVRNVRWLSDDRRRVEKIVSIVTRAGEKRRYQESVRLYSLTEMQEMLGRCGFTHIRAYGSLDGQRFSPASSRLVMVARKGNR